MRLTLRTLPAALFVLAALFVAAAASAEAVTDTPPERGALSANIYTHASAEYRACCMTIYRAAGDRLAELLEEDEARPDRPAVVMDLDETVLDITSFQTFLYESGLSYTSELWEVYEREWGEEVLLVPGAGEFIERAEALGVSVVYLSNRNESTREHTVAALERLGVNTEGIDERIYLKPTGGSSDKSPRRDAISARYNIVMIFGDNLRDFAEVFAPAKLGEDAATDDYIRATEARNAAVDAAACHWGVDWFVLPNCMYGEWEKLVPPNPVDVMRPTGMVAPETGR